LKPKTFAGAECFSKRRATRDKHGRRGSVGRVTSRHEHFDLTDVSKQHEQTRSISAEEYVERQTMKAVVFDLDGTVIDSAPDLHLAANRMLSDLRRPPLTLENVAGFVGNGVPSLVARCLAATGGPAKDLDYAILRFREHYARAPAHLTRPYAGVETMLQRLSGFGFALGICTNKPYEFAVAILEELRIMQFIGVVVGGDTLAKLKPDPAPLLLCLDRLGVAPASTLYVGDSEIDAETAFRAKVPFALYSGGYLRGSIDAFEPLYVFDHFEDLSDYMLQRGAAR